MTARPARSCLHSLPAFVGLGLLAGCLQAAPDPAPPTLPPPVIQPEAEAPPPLTAQPRQGPSAESLRLRTYYAEAARGLLARGYLRRDGGNPALDVPVLVRDFMSIAFFDETAAGPVPAPLRRWEKPVQIALQFGDSVPAAQRIRDRRTLSDLAATLSTDSGLPVTVTTEAGDFIVFITDEDERRALPEHLTRELEGLPLSEARQIVDLPLSTYCAAFAYTEGARSDYTRALAFIRAEQPDVLRESCLHEEIAQGFGLANDSPSARPSIFNDDEEFALLTPHDRALMRILYDPRLTPGMTAEQALPIVTLIAAELVPPST